MIFILYGLFDGDFVTSEFTTDNIIQAIEVFKATWPGVRLLDIDYN